MNGQASQGEPGVPKGAPGSLVPMLEARGLTKSFGGVRALRGADITVAPGEIHGIVGANGSGKSTFVKILAGYHQADAGEVRVRGEAVDLRHDLPRPGFRFVHQDLGLIGELSVAENLALRSDGDGFALRSLHGSRERAAAQALLDEHRLRIDAGTPVERLSPSQRTMVAVVRALHESEEEIDLLVLDEVTATLPPNDVAELFESIRELPKAGASVLFVSHHIEEVLDLCHRVSVFRSGAVVAVAERVGEQGTGHRELIELITGESVQDLYETPEAPGSQPVLSVSGLAAGKLAGIDLELREREIVGLASIDPAEASHLLRVLYGVHRRTAGTVELEGTELAPGLDPAEVSRRGVSLVANRLEGGIPIFNVRENLTLNSLDGFMRHGIFNNRLERSAVEVLIKDFAIVPKNGEAVFGTLSGGNQQKAILAKSMRLDPKVLLLDDPTQGVDAGAKTALHQIIRDACAEGLTVLVNSTDHEELCTLCHRVIALRDGHVNGVLGHGELTTANILARCYQRPAVSNGRST